MELIGKLNRTKQPVVKETTAFETSVHNTNAVDTIPDDTTVADKPAPSIYCHSRWGCSGCSQTSG